MKCENSGDEGGRISRMGKELVDRNRQDNRRTGRTRYSRGTEDREQRRWRRRRMGRRTGDIEDEKDEQQQEILEDIDRKSKMARDTVDHIVSLTRIVLFYRSAMPCPHSPVKSRQLG